MARPQSVDDDTLMGTLARVFRDVGYDGASMADLARASGRQKRSLYHRFPGGKAQVAGEVLARALDGIGQNVIGVLTSDLPHATGSWRSPGS